VGDAVEPGERGARGRGGRARAVGGCGGGGGGGRGSRRGRGRGGGRGGGRGDGRGGFGAAPAAAAARLVAEGREPGRVALAPRGLLRAGKGAAWRGVVASAWRRGRRAAEAEAEVGQLERRAALYRGGERGVDAAGMEPAAAAGGGG
jgi:hypothetical protein